LEEPFRKERNMSLPKLIGVIHLPPLAGSPAAHHQHPAEALQVAGFQAVREAEALAKAGFDGVFLENFGDAPFFKTQVPPETIASMAVIAAAVRESVKIQVGINVLRNDARAALAIAGVVGCDFIRVNVLSGVTATDQGLIEGDAAYLLRERDRLHVDVAILADVHVKHGQSLSSSDIGLAIEEVVLRGMADAVIVTGATTGRLVELSVLESASQFARAHQIPLYLGSGASHDNLREIKPWVDGIIVGSALRKGGAAGAPLDPKRVRDFVQGLSHATKKKEPRKKAKVAKSKSKRK
jgi:membrane complex biogenesis BtpA family protein